MDTFTSINDKPIENQKENLLGIENYAKALTQFLQESATPLTIGMQGEWGTGKTSLMYLVQEALDNKKVATSWVSTWEYSLFREPAQITPSVLKGLLDNLEQTCKKLDVWGPNQNFEKAKNNLLKVTKMFGTFAASAVIKKATGKDVEFNTEEPITVEIAELKKNIQESIKSVIEDKKNELKKVVFFIDDLDRIDPPVAVEILEALKNIFDIENCVFVLAIDYDVVIKGLEKKFGKKTEQNEREFRSFFDKIIQVPFSMPIGAYDINKLLESKLKDLGLSLNPELKEDYVQILHKTVGYIPRSIKRYVNSFSLLKNIKSIEFTEPTDNLNDFCLFALLGIQISYPKIYRLINKKQDFTKWDKLFAQQNGVDEIKVPDENHKFLDEEWEKVCWSYCQNDPYLKARVLSIIETLNLIREKLGDNFSEIIEQSMEFTSMTSVDDDIEAKQSAGKYQRTLYEGIDGYKHKLESGGARSEDIELLEYIYNDIKKLFASNDDVSYVYSKTGGVTLYAKGMKRGTKFAGIELVTSGKPYVWIGLLKDPRSQYKKPKIDGLEITNIRPYKAPLDLKRLPFIEYYGMKIYEKEQYAEKVRELIKSSYEIRQKDLPILKKGMPEVEMSINE
jgi:hypothetical protein